MRGDVPAANSGAAKSGSHEPAGRRVLGRKNERQARQLRGGSVSARPELSARVKAESDGAQDLGVQWETGGISDRIHEQVYAALLHEQRAFARRGRVMTLDIEVRMQLVKSSQAMLDVIVQQMSARAHADRSVR